MALVVMKVAFVLLSRHKIHCCVRPLFLGLCWWPSAANHRETHEDDAEVLFTVNKNWLNCLPLCFASATESASAAAVGQQLMMLRPRPPTSFLMVGWYKRFKQVTYSFGVMTTHGECAAS